MNNKENIVKNFLSKKPERKSSFGSISAFELVPINNTQKVLKRQNQDQISIKETSSAINSDFEAINRNFKIIKTRLVGVEQSQSILNEKYGKIERETFREKQQQTYQQKIKEGEDELSSLENSIISKLDKRKEASAAKINDSSSLVGMGLLGGALLLHFGPKIKEYVEKHAVDFIRKQFGFESLKDAEKRAKAEKAEKDSFAGDLFGTHAIIGHRKSTPIEKFIPELRPEWKKKDQETFKSGEERRKEEERRKNHRTHNPIEDKLPWLNKTWEKPKTERKVLGTSQWLQDQKTQIIIDKEEKRKEKLNFLTKGMLPEGFEQVTNRTMSPVTSSLGSSPSRTSGVYPHYSPPSIPGSGSKTVSSGSPKDTYKPKVFKTNNKTSGFVNPKAYGKEFDKTPEIDRKNFVNKQEFYNKAVKTFANSPLNGFVPKDGDRYGIDGSPESWAKFAMRVANQESSFKTTTRNPSDPGGSFGLFQFGFHYGITPENWKNPQAQLDAFVNYTNSWVVEGGGHILPDKSVKAKRYAGYGGFGAAFGSVRRHEIDQKRHFEVANKLAENAPQRKEVEEKKTASFRSAQEIGMPISQVKGTFEEKPDTVKVEKEPEDKLQFGNIRYGDTSNKPNVNDKIGSMRNIRRIDPQGNKTEKEFLNKTGRKKSPFNFVKTKEGMQKYGTPGQSGNLTRIKLSNGKIVTVHKKVSNRMKGFLNEMISRGYNIDQIYGASVRKISGTDSWSTHSWGTTVDINPRKNPYWKWGGRPGTTDMPENVKYLAMKWGFAQLGNDRMHFETVSPALRKQYAEELIASGFIKGNDPALKAMLNDGIINKEQFEKIASNTKEQTSTDFSTSDIVSEIEPTITKHELIQQGKWNFAENKPIDGLNTHSKPEKKEQPVTARIAENAVKIKSNVPGTTLEKPKMPEQKPSFGFSQKDIDEAMKSAPGHAAAGTQYGGKNITETQKQVVQEKATETPEKTGIQKTEEAKAPKPPEQTPVMDTNNGRGGSSGVPNLRYGPETESESPGSGGYGNKGRCFV